MLSICKVGSSRGAAYYLATLADAGGRAPAQPARRLVEPDGYWLGEAAAELGLAGSVLPVELERLLDGLHPATGSSLLELSSRARRSVAAYDCTFSCPKSVSLLHALGPPEAAPVVREAHDSAVAAALGYLEREASRVRYGSGGGRSVPGRGIVAAVFPHRTSRAPDPHLHSHVLVANLVPEPGGGWRSLDARKWYRESRAAGALYEAHLRCELTRSLQVRFCDLGGKPWADIAGVQAGWRIEFSRRGRAIEQALSESQLDARAGSIVAAVTRPRKDFATPYDDHVGAWRERGYRVGLAEPFLAALTHRRLTGPPPAGPIAKDRSVREALEAGSLERATVSLALARSSDRSFSRSELIRARCSTAPQGMRAEDVERDVDRLLGGADSPAGVGVGAGAGAGAGARAGLDAGFGIVRRGVTMPVNSRGGHRVPVAEPEARFTTQEVLRQEARLLGIVRAAPSRFRTVAYEDDSRLEALEAVAGRHSPVAGRHSPAVPRRLAVAPSPVSASAFEALTGIPAVGEFAGLEELARHRLRGASDFEVVLVDPHRMAPGELEAAIEQVGDSSVALLVSAGAAERHPLLKGITETSREHEVLPAPPEGGRQRLVFGAVDVTLARGPLEVVAAVRETVETLATPLRPGEDGRGPAIVVATGEKAVARHLRRLGIGAPVLEGPELRAVLSQRRGGGDRDREVTAQPAGEGRTAPVHVVVVGGAAELRLAQRELDGLRRTHVLAAPAGYSVAPGQPCGPVRSAVAVLVRPCYLVAELGVPPGATAAREAWRRGASVVEEYRERHSFHDPRRAFESGREASELRSERRAELATAMERVNEIKRQTRELGRPLGRALNRGRSVGHGLDR